MAFPVAPANGQTAVVNNITYQFSNVGNTWTRLVSTANVITANTIVSNGLISATGNVSGNYILGNGALLTGVSTTSSNINNGTSNVTVVSSGGNVTVGIGGTGNVAVFATTGEYITGVLSASGNVTGGNLRTSGSISATGTLSVTGNTTLSTLSTGNLSSGNILSGGVISALGNITGNYFIGNGSALTGIVAGGGATTFSNIAPSSPAAGDVWIQANTAIQYVYFDDTTSSQWAEMEAYQSFSGSGGAGTPGGANTQIQFNDSDSFGASANLTFNNATNTLSTTTISATGNVTAGYFVGNGSQLTGTAMSWSIANSNVTMSTNRGYFVDTTGGAKTMTLPASATIGDTVRINDLAGTFATNNLTVARNGSNIQGAAEDLSVTVNQSSFGLVYSNSTYGWKLLEF